MTAKEDKEKERPAEKISASLSGKKWIEGL